MFNGYNETPLISYNEFNQERIEKKQENVPKWSYGPDSGGQHVQTHPNNRNSEFWSGKSNFLGTPSLVKCNCAACYTSTENQSYQGDANRHRPWLPRTFPVPLNGSNESCKLPAYQWDNGLSSQNPCYPENSLPYVQENGGGRYSKYSYYRHYQNAKLPEANQPGVITSVKDAEYPKKPKNEMSSRGMESPIQNATRQTEFCNAAYSLTKKVDGRSYCNPNDKYSNIASCSVEQHISRVPVVEPFLKAVPSNLSQNRVPSTGYRSVKENIPQPYIDSGYGDARKICTEPTANSEKRNELLSAGQLQTGVHLDYSLFNRDLQEEEQQKLYFDTSRHPDYYSRNNIQDMLKRNHVILDNRKDCAMNQISQISMPEQQYNASRTKYQEVGNYKSSFESFYPKEFEKTRPENHLPENPARFQRLEDTKNENANVHSRFSRSALLFNDAGFSDKPQNSFLYQSNPMAYRNHLRSEYSYQNMNAQVRFEYPSGFQRNDLNQYRVTSQQSCEQLVSQQGSALANSHCHQNPSKAEEICGQKNPSSVQTDFQALESRKTNYLESIRSEEISKNGTSKISPLRLLRKKKFINVPHESTPVSTLDSVPELDVRKFWSTWAEEEEEENVGPTQMVVLDCQNIDPEQVKMLTTPMNLYDTDPVRTVHAESDRLVIKGSNCPKESNIQRVNFEESKTCQEPVANDATMNDDRGNTINEKSIRQQEEAHKADGSNPTPKSEEDSKSSTNESICPLTSPTKNFKKVKSESEIQEKRKTEIMDKWTEKKFDFLKRAEESKAAEVLRHEEEKKKIFETRLSLQQTFKKTQKLQEKNISENESTPERASSFDENSRSNSPHERNMDAFNLPTSEYRRNKFLDYSDKKVILNGKNEIETNETEGADDPTSNEIKIKKNVKLECWDKWLDKCQTEKEFSSLNPKIKEEAGVQMNDIVKKMSDINFQSSGLAVENEAERTSAKKWKPIAKKTKKKKSDQPTENEERTNKLTVETVSKPTIKFSIQKSHDLKISFKVLNSSKEYSDEDVGREDAEAEGNTLEESKNSTELITLKYKSIQRDCDRKQSLDFIKNKRGFRKKKRSSEMKTPVLKIKKSRYMPQEEQDPLANDEKCLSASKKPYLDDYGTPDDFQVQETVDSAKIKLTFKRNNKGIFDTEYKINSNNDEEVSRLEPTPEEHFEMAKTRKKAKRANQEFFNETGVECFQEFPEPSTVIESASENEKPQMEPVLSENSRKSSTLQYTCTEKENEAFEPSVMPYSDFPSDPQFPVPTSENSPLDYEKLVLSEENENRDAIEDSKSYRETNKCDQEGVEFIVNHVINCDEANGSADNRDEFSLLNCNASPSVNLKQLTLVEVGSLEESKEKTVDFDKEEIQEISLDFIRSTKPSEIEINHRLEKTEETKIILNVENNAETPNKKSSDLGDLHEIKHSSNLENSYESKSGKVSENEEVNGLEDSKIIEDSYYWKDDPLCNDVVDKSNDNVFENVKEGSSDSEETSIASLSLLELENYNFKRNFAALPKHDTIANEKTKNLETEEGTSEDAVKRCLAEDCIDISKENPRCKNYPHPEIDESPAPDSELGDENLKGLVEDLASKGTMSAKNVFENYNGSLTSETPPEDPNIPTEIIIPSETEEKPNENYREISDLEHPEPEETNPSSLELTLEEAVENLTKSHFVSVLSPEKASEGESADWKNTDKIFESDACRLLENLSPDLSLKNDFKTGLPKIEFSQLQEKSELTFEEGKGSSVNVDDPKGSVQNETNESENEKNSGLKDCSILEKTKTSKNALQDTNDLSVKQSDELVYKNAKKEQNDDSTQNISSSKFEVLTKNEEFLHHSVEMGYSEQPGGKVLEYESVSTTPFEPFESSSNVMENPANENVARGSQVDLSLPSNVELEDGEIIDSSDEVEEKASCKEQITDVIQPFDGFPNASETQKRQTDFIIRKIERRHSVKPDKIRKRKESQSSELKTWSRRKFSKAKSCPPTQKFREGLLFKKEKMLSIAVEEIPLPVGPPPLENCHNFKMSMGSRSQVESAFTEAREKPKESISPKRPQVSQKEIPQPNSPSCCPSPFDLNDLQNCRNPSPPVFDKENSSRLGTFPRDSKIKFSFLKRSKFSKIDLKNNVDPQSKFSSQALITESKSLEEPGKKDVKSCGFKISEKIRTPLQDSAPMECQMEGVPNTKVAYETEEAKNCNEDSEKIQESRTDLEQPVQLLGEDLDESVRVIDVMGDFMRDEFYECEDIPTSEDLTNGDDLENEKVNDDKFRNIMQNCLDNAKKFLNVGNLKLFSCSIDDLLELDCQTSESGLGEKPANHISRDVLLTSCEDTNDDLGLSENVPPADISMDFVPSFCSDVCPEILPVDNWPYLEEEVASSPAKSKQDDADLIPPLEDASSISQSESRLKFSTENGNDRAARKRVVSETNMKSFRRRSLISDEEALRICSKIGAQRRKTIDSFTEMPCGSDIRDIKNELVKLKNGTKERERKSLKCRLSLEKLTSKHGLNFEFKKEKLFENGMRVKSAKNLDYKSPLWQPKVMLFRISKNELKKMVGNSKIPKQWGPKNSRDSPKKESSYHLGNEGMFSVKKEKLETKSDEEVKMEDGRRFGDEKLVNLPQFDSIKGSLTVISSKDSDVKKRRKARFRNLHSKRKLDPGTSKNENLTGQNNPFAESSPFDAEVALTKLFKHCSRPSNFQVENSKEMVSPKHGDEKIKKKLIEIKPVVTEYGQKSSSGNEKKLEKETEPLRSHGKSKESKDDKYFSEKSEKTHDHKDIRREKSEGREQRIQKDKHKENEKEKHRRHDRRKRLDKKISSGKNEERFRTTSGGGESEQKSQKAVAHESPWTCEVCGFENANERVLHIKSHPFHCQSCYLAFKTETHFIGHLTKNHKDIRNQHHCLLCELSFDTEEQYYKHLETREHRHLECVEKNTINTLFTLLTGAPCPVLGLVEMKPEWLPNQSGTVHFYHQATPLSLALQYLKMHQDLSSFSAASSIHPT